MTDRSSTGASSSAFRLFITRLHFYVGLFVGPFIFIAALTGTLYVLTPQIESLIYHDQLQTASTGMPQSLAAQIGAARAAVGDELKLFAVRPATADGYTTRVMFTEPGLGDSENRAIFVDPVSLAVQGDLIVYGTSGILPFRTTIDYLHRNLLLGDFGRHYSELAASWLWVAVFGGVLLWFWRRGVPKSSAAKGASARRLHGRIGVIIAAGLLFLSATGLTWSRWAGDHIDRFRSEVGWVTPSVSLDLGPGAVAAGGEHAEHQGHGAATAPTTSSAISEVDVIGRMDQVLAAARAGGIDSPMVEIRPPRAAGKAWMVREYDRGWPTQVDTIAIDPGTMAITSRADFETFPIVVKLIRWGIDAHMGILFGVANQIVMAALGIALMAMIVYGYVIWWSRRPAPGGSPKTLVRAFSYLTLPSKLVLVVLVAGFGVALPLMGASLIVFVLVDLVRWGLTGLADGSGSQGVRRTG
ncbi:PepSY-associated TM helix domain-containing protein [Neorhizobium petrolearium]|uniref:PepSY-associated TM helix domain-containing protein n=1 Tax=Neorhizobium petrolearium TaxID=515361 RepID=UPI003F5CCA69